MAIFDEILKPEESAAGFAPGEPDDDVFLLETKPTYPGVIPDFEETPAIKVSEPESEEIIEDEIVSAENIESNKLIIDQNDGVSSAELIEIEDGASVWDSFDGNTSNEEPEEILSSTKLEQESEEELSSTKLEQETEELLSSTKLEQESDELLSSTKLEQESEELLSNTKLEQESEELLSNTNVEDESEEEYLFGSEVETEPVDEYNLPDVPETKKAKPSSSESNADILDDELRRLIQSDLDKGKGKKTTVKESVPEIENLVEKVSPAKGGKSDSAMPVDSAKDAVMIDMSSMNGDEEIDSEIKPDSSENKKNANKENKEKKKIIITWIPLSYAAVVFLILSVVGLGGYYAWDHYVINPVKGEIAKSDMPKANTDKHKATNTVESKTHKEQATASLHDKSKHTDAAELKSDSIAETPTDKKKSEAQEIQTKKEIEAPKIETKPTHISEAKIEKPAAKVVKKEQIKKKVQAPVKEKIIKKKETKPVVVKEPVKTTVNETNTQTASSTNLESVYVVQVYASPSEKDAKDWLEKLKKKGAPSVFISTQKKRDVIWYRVRFGNYNTRESAQNAALRYGFSQSWIDRIR